VPYDARVLDNAHQRPLLALGQAATAFAAVRVLLLSGVLQQLNGTALALMPAPALAAHAGSVADVPRPSRLRKRAASGAVSAAPAAGSPVGCSPLSQPSSDFDSPPMRKRLRSAGQTAVAQLPNGTAGRRGAVLLDSPSPPVPPPQRLPAAAAPAQRSQVIDLSTQEELPEAPAGCARCPICTVVVSQKLIQA
jgi:hypothetical protein